MDFRAIHLEIVYSLIFHRLHSTRFTSVPLPPFVHCSSIEMHLPRQPHSAYLFVFSLFDVFLLSLLVVRRFRRRRRRRRNAAVVKTSQQFELIRTKR